MKTRLGLVTGAVIALTGCGQREVERTPEALEHEALKRFDPSHEFAAPPAISGVSIREGGHARVVAVDAAQGSITLRHTQQGAGDWPSLNMTLRARPTLLTNVRAGDEVDFSLAATDGGEVADLKRRRTAR